MIKTIESLIDTRIAEAEYYEDEMYRQGYTDALEDIRASIKYEERNIAMDAIMSLIREALEREGE